jgi:ferredoxin
MSDTFAANDEHAALEQLGQGLARLARALPPIDLPAAERIARAKRVFIEKTDAEVALDLESCIHCGMCAEACHFYEGTGEGRYAPIHKLKLLRKVYRRELGPLRIFHKLLSRDVTVAELEEWQALVFDSCTECGRCDMICPLGVQLSRGVHITRRRPRAGGAACARCRAEEHGCDLRRGPRETAQRARGAARAGHRGAARQAAGRVSAAHHGTGSADLPSLARRYGAHHEPSRVRLDLCEQRLRSGEFRRAFRG